MQNYLLKILFSKKAGGSYPHLTHSGLVAPWLAMNSPRVKDLQELLSLKKLLNK